MTPTLEDLARAIEAFGDALDEVAEGRDLDAKAIHDLRKNYESMRHTVDDPNNTRNLRDETTRAHTRIDGHDTRFAERPVSGEGGWKAALASALAKPIEATGNALKGLPWHVIYALCLTGILVVLMVTGQLVPLIRAVRGAPETSIEAPGATIDAPASNIHR